MEPYRHRIVLRGMVHVFCNLYRWNRFFCWGVGDTLGRVFYDCNHFAVFRGNKKIYHIWEDAHNFCIFSNQDVDTFLYKTNSTLFMPLRQTSQTFHIICMFALTTAIFNLSWKYIFLHPIFINHTIDAHSLITMITLARLKHKDL